MAEKWAMLALQQRRLRASRLENLNDPFELLGTDLRDPEDRQVFLRLKKELHEEVGVFCFSRSWSNPVLWSHYGDKHRGICLGFDLLDDWVREVTYAGERISREAERAGATSSEPDLGTMLLTTKFEHWSYEDEVRFIVRLNDLIQDGCNHFLPFGPPLQLRQVVIGPRCKSTIRDVRATLGPEDKAVTITKARLAFGSFRVVRDRRVGGGPSV